MCQETEYIRVPFEIRLSIELSITLITGAIIKCNKQIDYLK
jgi:hypothetical protein